MADDGMLDFDVEPVGPFICDSWQSGFEGWYAMPASGPWKPKAKMLDAVIHCLEWTGLIGIPAMRVRDMTTGEVVWQESSQYPQAGESIPLRNEAEVVASVRASQAERFAREDQGVPYGAPPDDDDELDQ